MHLLKHEKVLFSVVPSFVDNCLLHLFKGRWTSSYCKQGIPSQRKDERSRVLTALYFRCEQLEDGAAVREDSVEADADIGHEHTLPLPPNQRQAGTSSTALVVCTTSSLLFPEQI